MPTQINFNTLVNELKSKEIYMFIGNGSKNQFRYMRKIYAIVSKILKKIPKNSVFLYFGDPPNEKKPDIGMVFPFIAKSRPDLKIYMIQILMAKNWGVRILTSCIFALHCYLLDRRCDFVFIFPALCLH